MNVSTPPNHYEKRKNRTKKRHAKIIQMYDDLYHLERKRIDDVEKQVADFWEISIITLRNIMSQGV